MKTRTAVAALVVLIMSQSQGWAQEKYVPSEDEELYGTWTNEEYSGYHNPQPQRDVVSADGYKHFANVADSTPFEERTLQIASKWTDSMGNIWYRTFGTFTSGQYIRCHFQELDKISNAGKVWEYVRVLLLPDAEIDPENFPSAIDPDDRTYNVRYRAIE
jgi:hypothetical protein